MKNKNIILTLVSMFILSSNFVFGGQETEVATVFSGAKSVFDYARNSLNSGVCIALGCGITSGSSPVTYDPWPERLENMLSGVSVVNLGISHSYASDGAGNINYYMKTYYPQYVLILYGVNDAKLGIPNSTIIDNLETIVETAQAYGAKVVLGTLPLVPNFSTYEASVVQDLNDDIRNMKWRYGIEIADVESVMGYRNSSLYLDGLHPTRTGYNMIAAEYSDEISITSLPGGGTVSNPYIIDSLADFQEFYSNAKLISGYYKLNVDINLQNQQFSSAVVNRSFAGYFDGSGHVVSNFVVQSTSDYTGLFRFLNGGTIKSLIVEGFTISGATYSGGLCGRNERGNILSCRADGVVVGDLDVGGLAGYNYYGVIDECSSVGAVQGNDFVGGLVGCNYGGTIKQSYAESSVSGVEYVSAFLGFNHAGSIDSCFSEGDVSGDRFVGGLVGHNYQGTVTNVYSWSTVSGNDYVGGLVGYNDVGTIDCSYSTGSVLGGTNNVGGFIGGNVGSVSSCFWDTETSNQTNSFGGVGKTTLEMQMHSTFDSVGWNFVDIWLMDGYPVLTWQAYELVVESGSGDGFYMPETIVEIFADPPAEGLEFGSWSVSPDIYNSNFADMTSSNTSFVMPDESVSVQVIYKPLYYNSGEGTKDSPYLINSTRDLIILASRTSDYGKCFKLTADIDLSGESFVTAVIAPDTSTSYGFQGTKFTGSFDGDGHEIRNLTISGSSDYVSLFGYVDSGATISKLGVVDSSVTGKNYAGGLIGYNEGIVENCYSWSVVSSAAWYAGGFAGINYGTINDCYSIGSVSGVSATGGFCGSSSGTISDCFWNTQTSGRSTSSGGTGKTTAQMQIESTFTSAGWSFGNIWYMDGYPVLFSLSDPVYLLDVQFGSARGYYSEGEVVEIVADEPVTGYEFTGWTVDPAGYAVNIGDTNVASTTFLMPSEYVSLTANYLQKTYQFTTISGEHGSITPENPVVTHGADRTFTIVTDAEYHIASLLINGVSTPAVSSYTFSNVTSANTIEVAFATNITYILSVVSGTGDDSYLSGQSVDIVADTPDTGYEFTGWTVDPIEYAVNIGDSSESSTTFIMPSADVIITAQYAFITKYSGGAGTVANPYKIANKADLLELVANNDDYDKYFKMTADIDLAGESFTTAVIAPDTSTSYGFQGTKFTGSFDGNGYKVCNLTISGSLDYISLFGYVGTGATISNLGIVDSSVTGKNYAGGLIGYNEGTVENCYSWSTVSSAAWYVGGFVGINYGIISNCYSIGYVTGVGAVGGFCGSSSGTISDCFWNTQTSGWSSSSGGTGKTTVQMQTQSTFSVWDFVDIWYMDGYPAIVCFEARYENWAVKFAVPVNQRGYADAPAGDGIQNLLKYAIGLNPMLSCLPEDVLVPLDGEETGTFAVSYRKAKGTEDVLLFPIWTDSLIITNWGTNGFVYTMMSETASNETWKATLPMTNDCGYIRLKATTED
ncbi:MAG: SGNH/GDSL hydrolase family protein [Kiritimatiellae bacterium]|nr:SGNH/GDSL hydrolase family protein [Kiritimatiellia bacterium]